MNTQLVKPDSETIEFPVLERLESCLEKSLIDQSEILTEIGNKLYKIKALEITKLEGQIKRPTPIDFTMKYHDLLEHLYDNNQRLHKIFSHLSQII